MVTTIAILLFSVAVYCYCNVHEKNERLLASNLELERHITILKSSLDKIRKAEMDELQYRNNMILCGHRYLTMAHEDGDSTLIEFVNTFMSSALTLPILKLNRWLGYIQGVLIERKCTTVDIERDWSRRLFRPLDYRDENDE